LKGTCDDSAQETGKDTVPRRSVEGAARVLANGLLAV